MASRFASLLRGSTRGTAAAAAAEANAKGIRMTGNFTPVFVSLGLILLSTSLGAYSLERQLAHSPTVRVSKKRRETLPEVDEPERVATEAEQYVKSSIFRKVAHVQDFDAVRAGISDPTLATDPFERYRERSSDLSEASGDRTLKLQKGQCSLAMPA